jgi:hypothetical protein
MLDQAPLLFSDSYCTLKRSTGENFSGIVNFALKKHDRMRLEAGGKAPNTATYLSYELEIAN